MSFHDETGAHHGRIGSIADLPRVVAHHDNWRSGRLVVIRGKHPPAKSSHSKRREIVACYVLRAQRPRRESAALPPHTQPIPPRLKCGHFFEFGSFRLETLIQRKGEHSPALLRTPFHTAIIAISDTIQKSRIRNRQ